MGRPLVAKSELRDAVEVYLSPNENEMISSRANQAGLSLSGYIRRAALRHKVHAVPQPNAQKWADLARLSSNFNQLLHHLNTGNTVGVSPDDLLRIEKSVQGLRNELIGIKGGENDSEDC